MDKDVLYIQEPSPSIEENKLAAMLVEKEKAALDRWFKGDISGYADLWSERSFSYFDAVVRHRIDSHHEIMNFLHSIEGKLFAETYEFREPRVQISPRYGNIDLSVICQFQFNEYGI